MLLVPGGPFDMGNPFNTGHADEKPVHSVTLTDYEIGRLEITNQQVADVLNWANANGRITSISNKWVEAFGKRLVWLNASACQIS